MKNYIKPGQKLPVFGIGPYMMVTIGVIALIGIFISGSLLESGIVDGIAVWIFRIVGIVLLILGIIILFYAVFRSNIINSIADNALKTNGIYAWVRNPMYSGIWIILIGIVLMWHNLWLLLIIPIGWSIMTIVLKNTEEKWLKDLYGQQYEEYMKNVNRCIPWFPKK